MAKVKGYFNTRTNVFLGLIEIAGNQMAARYLDGICFGEYDTDTDEFVPHTNPYIIPKGDVQIIGSEEGDVGKDGKLIVQGGLIDKGADLARRKVYQGHSSYETPNVSTSLDRMRTQMVKTVHFDDIDVPQQIEQNNINSVVDEGPEKPVEEVVKKPTTKSSMLVDWESLL